MQVVLDTNILFSALISPRGFSNTIYTAWRRNKFTLITSTIQLEELKQASRYPKFKNILQPSRVGAMINNLQNAIILETLSHNTIPVEDPNDAFLIGMSITGKADYLITGDRRAGLLNKKNIGRTQILVPAVFCSHILKIEPLN